MTDFWTPLAAFTGVALIYVVSEILSSLVKGNASSLLFASALFIIGFWSGILPPDITARSGLTGLMNNFGMALLITNLGTLIDVETLLREWRTVAVALSGLAGVALAAFTVCTALFGREYALAAAPSVAGGTVATLIVQEATILANRPEVGAFATLVIVFERFLSVPLAKYGLRKELARKMASGDFAPGTQHQAVPQKNPPKRVFKATPAKYSTTTIHLFRLSSVALLAHMAAHIGQISAYGLVRYWLNPNILYLLFGLLFTRWGFLEKSALQKAQSYGLAMFGLMTLLPGVFAGLSPRVLLGMLLPLFGVLLISSVAVCAVAVVVGRRVGYSPQLSSAIGMTCMLGYPVTEHLANEVVENMDVDDQDVKDLALAYILPKMVVGGFAAVTIASVVFASFMAPLIFK